MRKRSPCEFAQLLATWRAWGGSRSQEIARVTSLQEQNAQLKALINQYLNAKVNDELIVPPAATIAMNQQAAQTSAEG